MSIIFIYMYLFILSVITVKLKKLRTPEMFLERYRVTREEPIRQKKTLKSLLQNLN